MQINQIFEQEKYHQKSTTKVSVQCPPIVLFPQKSAEQENKSNDDVTFLLEFP